MLRRIVAILFLLSVSTGFGQTYRIIVHHSAGPEEMLISLPHNNYLYFYDKHENDFYGPCALKGTISNEEYDQHFNDQQLVTEDGRLCPILNPRQFSGTVRYMILVTTEIRRTNPDLPIPCRPTLLDCLFSKLVRLRILCGDFCNRCCHKDNRRKE